MDRLRFFVAALGLLALAPASAFETDGAGKILFNEIQTANVDMFVDPSFNYGAWVELLNTTGEPLSLSRMTLRHTDSEGVVSQQLLSLDHGLLPAHGFGNLWFDHNSAYGYYGGNSASQIPFKLDADGGLLELLDIDGAVVDVVAYPPAVARCSYARVADGGEQWGWTSQPTPGRTNAGSAFADEILEKPQPDSDGGLFAGSTRFSVAIPQGTTLYYTTDGSAPVAGRSAVSADGRFSVDTTCIYRMMFCEEGYLNSPVVTRSFIRSDHDYYLPILSVSSHPDNFFGDMLGLYVRGTNGRRGNNQTVACNQNMDWDRPVNVEYFVPDAAAKRYHACLNQGAQFAIFGGWTRFNQGDDFFEFKPSFKLKASRLCGDDNFFPYPVFSAKPFVKLKHLLVRNGGQDQHARIWDAAIQELIRSSGFYVDCQAWQPAHTFLNGHYLGTFNLREASNMKYAYSNYGIGDDEIDQWENEFAVKVGDRLIYDEWYNLSRRLTGAATDADVWQEICKRVDVDEYCNYMAAETYIGNLDWLRGSLKNVKGFHARDDDGRIHVVLFDVDGGFGDTDMLAQLYAKGTGRLSYIFRNMMKYEPFRKQFTDAYCLLDGSVFEPSRSVPIVKAMAATTNPALQWEGNESLAKANLLCERLSSQTLRRERMETLKAQLGLTDEYRLTLSAERPDARLLLDGQEIPTARFDGVLFAPIRLTAPSPAGYALRGWMVDGSVVSADSVFDLSQHVAPGTHEVKALYERRDAPSTVPPIRINEVSAANNIFISDYMKKSDWLELYNTTDKPIDLAGMYLSDNSRKPHKYQIEPVGNTLIAPHGYRVVWCDGREPLTQLHASFKLANDDGQFVRIEAADGSWADSLYYMPQNRFQSFGRYPDGGNDVALFDRMTIGETNHVNTQTVMSQPLEFTAIAAVPYSRAVDGAGRVVAVQYFNLGGQRISHPSQSRIVLQKIIYADGTSTVRKVGM